VRDRTAKDFAGTMREVAAIGYTAVELAGFGNLSSAAEAKKALDDAGLTVSGCHVSIERMGKELEKALDENYLFGNKNIICPFLDGSYRNADGYKRAARELTEFGQICHNRGFILSYHNHSFEFKQFDGKSGLDILFDSADPFLVRAELDVYWLKHGGVDPVEYIRKMGKRVQLLHLKDMAAGTDQRFAEVGTGILDFKAIIDEAVKHGVQWGAVEQDDCYGRSTVEAIKTSFENLQQLNA
jgi:sugar phosphate isomerase/epimerase